MLTDFYNIWHKIYWDNMYESTIFRYNLTKLGDKVFIFLFNSCVKFHSKICTCCWYINKSWRIVSLTLTVDGLLGLPRPSFNGLCSYMTPVHFLQEFSSSCVVPLTEDSCSAAGPLSALRYASSPDWGTVDTVGVQTHPDGRPTTMDVHFLCVNSSKFAKYSKDLASANAPHRSYSLFAGCPAECPPASTIVMNHLPLSWWVRFVKRVASDIIFTLHVWNIRLQRVPRS